MKIAFCLSLLFSFSASADAYFTGSSESKSVVSELPATGSYMTASSSVKSTGRETASDKKQKSELLPTEDAYFTGSSIK